MTDFNHTPGPWAHAGKYLVRLPEDPIHPKYVGPMICRTRIAGGPWGVKEAEANARLIALAPRMLDAIAEFVRKVEAGEARSKKSYAEMRAILAELTPNGETCDDN